MESSDEYSVSESDESGYSGSENESVLIDPEVDEREVKVTSSSSSAVSWSCSCRMSSQTAASSAQASTIGESVDEVLLDSGSASESS